MPFTSLTDTHTLYNGVEIPCLGFGTWQTPNGETAKQSVKDAIELGYRHIDTAADYGNEETVGQGIHESGVPRKEIFVTSKILNKDRGYPSCHIALRYTLQRLQMDYLDLYLIHWPASFHRYHNWKQINADTWRGFEEMYYMDQVRAIGVSNFRQNHLKALMETAELKPMVNQIAVHPGWGQLELVKYCQDNGIIVEGYSPLGTGALLQNPDLLRIAGKYQVTVPQLCIRWSLQHGVVPIAKSTHKQYIDQNAQVFGFAIDKADMDFIDTMERCGGTCANPDAVDW